MSATNSLKQWQVVIVIIVVVIVTIIVLGGGWLFTCSQDPQYVQVHPQVYTAFECRFVLSHIFELLISVLM